MEMLLFTPAETRKSSLPLSIRLHLFLSCNFLPARLLWKGPFCNISVCCVTYLFKTPTNHQTIPSIRYCVTTILIITIIIVISNNYLVLSVAKKQSNQFRSPDPVAPQTLSLADSAPWRPARERSHGILFGADGGSHSWALWSVRRQHFRSAFCSTRGEPLDDRNNRHISHLLSKFAALTVHVGADRLKLRRTNVSPGM